MNKEHQGWTKDSPGNGITTNQLGVTRQGGKHRREQHNQATAPLLVETKSATEMRAEQRWRKAAERQLVRSDEGRHPRRREWPAPQGGPQNQQ